VTPRWACPFVAAVLAAIVVAPVHARAQNWIESNQVAPNTTPAELTGVDIVEHLGGALPGDAIFRDADGKPTTLGAYFDSKRPTLLVFAYHTCPMLCSLVLDAAVRSLNGIAWTVGREFDVVSISIDPKDTPETATRKRAQVVGSYGKANGSVAGWHFLVGDEANIRKVTNAVGFRYNYDARQKQYAHPAAIFLLSPDGRVARYLYGIEYSPSDVRLGLLEASEGRSISTTERILLYCYHYDPQGKHYSLVAMNVMRLGGVVTLIAIGSFLIGMWARERSRRARPTTAPAGCDPRKAAALGPDLRALRSAQGTEAARVAALRQTGKLDGLPPSTWPRQGS
jgi:protein SCO1/2